MTHATFRPSDVIRTVKAYPLIVIAPVLLTTLAAVGYAVMRPATWEATQALVVRDETGDRLSRPGKFTHTDEMKISQETIMELAKSRAVLAGALKDVGPPSGTTLTDNWPSQQSLEALQGQVKITPPKGAEFGKTEVFYLKVQSESQPRAIALAAAICHQLQTQLGELREAKAKSTTDELTESARMAREDLTAATGALSEMELLIGSDLAELRSLSESPSGESDLRRTAAELDKELRTYYGTQTENEEFLTLLTRAQVDPGKLLASTSVLLKSQPALGRLKDGLVDAQLRTGQLLGTMSEQHPLVRAGRESELAIRRQLHDELSVAIKGVELDLRVNGERIQSLQEQSASVHERMERLAMVRAEYANLVNATKQRAESLKTVEHELSEARASQAAARTASLLNLVDRAETGAYPLGPGKSSIVAAGFSGGVLIALALVLLLLPYAVKAGHGLGSIPVQQSRRGERTSGLNLKQALQRVAPGGI